MASCSPPRDLQLQNKAIFESYRIVVVDRNAPSSSKPYLLTEDSKAVSSLKVYPFSPALHSSPWYQRVGLYRSYLPHGIYYGSPSGRQRWPSKDRALLGLFKWHRNRSLDRDYHPYGQTSHSIWETFGSQTYDAAFSDPSRWQWGFIAFCRLRNQLLCIHAVYHGNALKPAHKHQGRGSVMVM